MTGAAPAPGRGDSAGQPWAGRALAAQPFAGDDGSADPALAAALDSGDVPAAVDALASARVVVPVVAVLAEADATTGGEKSTDMAVPSLQAPDGRRALPAFSSTAALAAWAADARPVPVEGARAALAAAAEGCDLLVLDPGTASLVVPRPAVAALAQGRPWTPSGKDPAVLDALRAAAAGEAAVRAVDVEPGRRAELSAVVRLAPGLDRDQLGEVVRRLQAAWAASAVVAERVDSLEVRVVADPSPTAAAGPASPG